MLAFYPQIKLVHIAAVSASGAFFALRALGLLAGMRWPRMAPVRYLSYTIDTTLLTAAMMLLTGLAVWRWWPRGPMPGLLAVLFIGTLWLPVTFALYTAQSLVFAFDGGFILGRAPMHALFVGFFGSLLVAMVTRVTQGHSGQPLTMYPIAWFAFVAIQIVATVRILADVLPDPGLWQALAAVGWLLALSPWVMRIGHIYLTPRRDGRPG